MGRIFVQTSGAGDTVSSAAAGVTPPGAEVLTINSAFFNQLTGIGSVSVTSTNPGGTFKGVHFYLEIPDLSGAQVVDASSTLTGNDVLSSQWIYQDLGRQSFDSTQQPWILDLIVPVGQDLTKDIPCRLYGVPYSDQVESRPVRNGLSGASPNVAFTAVSLGSGTPSAGTNVTTLTTASGSSVGLVVTAEAPDNSTGKLKTPFLADVTDTPDVKGWAFQLVVTFGNADPGVAANQFIVSGIETDAGQVVAAADGVSIPHSFLLDTPTTIQTLTVWLQAGLIDADGHFQGNNIVPGITPSWMVTYGSTTGTHDASAIMAATVNSSMAVVDGLFGVAPMGITNPYMGSGAIATINVQSLAITNPLLASLAVQAANMASGSVTAANGALASLSVGTAAIQLLAVDTTLIANLAVSAAKILTATITGAQIASATISGANIGTATIAQANIANLAVGTAQIQNLAITDAKINDLSASKITAGTISASISITAPTINGGSFTSTSGTATTVLSTGSVVSTDSSLGITGLQGGLLSGQLFAQGTYTGILSQMSCSLWSLQFAVGGAQKVEIGAFLAGGSHDGYIKINGNMGYTGTVASAAGRNILGGIII
jgi:hypothetical protein